MRALLFCLTLAAFASADEDPYLAYLKTAPEWTRVPEIRAKRWRTWIYMPWTYRWTIGHDDAAAKFCKDHGINGGFTDHGEGPIEWFEKHNLLFYNDHTAGKGWLYLRGANQRDNFTRYQRDPRAVRIVPLNERALIACRGLIRQNLRDVARSPNRIAYALDDEISTGAFVMPLPWRVDSDDKAYESWLKTYYGKAVAPQYVTPDFTRKQLGGKLADLDFSPLLDRMSYHDSRLAMFVGALVATANEVDGETPCGFVGAQNPSLWGGYDYAKLMKKVQFIEPYDIGSAPAIARSLGPATVVSTHFHDGELKTDTWKAWYRFAHGQRGMIGWIEKWFDGKKPRPWLAGFGETLKELAALGTKVDGATFIDDGIALYYSHPSIQVSWVLDAEPHGATWPNRGKDHIRGTSHNVRRAWEYILADSGLQYRYVGYDDVARDGVPKDVKVLILPACYALSDVEARRIAEFTARGGRLVADFLCGIFDQHGKGRTRGALDDLIFVRHAGTLSKRDVFGGTLWVETNQDKGYGAKRWRDLLGTAAAETRGGFHVALRGVAPTARYLNLSPQMYLQLREEGRAEPRHRALFTEPLGVTPRVRIEGEPHIEPLYWKKGGRTLLLLVQNPIERGDGSRKVLRGKARVTLAFASPVRDLVDERTGERIGGGNRFRFSFERTEAVFLSYR